MFVHVPDLVRSLGARPLGPSDFSLNTQLDMKSPDAFRGSSQASPSEEAKLESMA